MKKNLLNFLTLTVCICLLSFKTFAQDAPGTYGEGGIDGGVTTPASSYQSAPPPNFVLNLKRNNGNGHCAGSGLATLNFKGTAPEWMNLVAIADLGGKELTGAVLDGSGVWLKGALTYCLSYNIPPKNKLMFHFTWSGGDFWIPEM